MTALSPISIDPRTFFRKQDALPALPQVIGQIQSIIRDPNVDVVAVSELISADPGLVAQLLKIVNSAYFGLSREITEVRLAIAYLGLNEVYHLVLSLAVLNTLDIKQTEELIKFWFHSFYAALCTKYLAKRYEPLLSYEELWSAAMLHDIGKLVYLKFFPEHYMALISFKEQEGCFFSDAEKHFSLPPSASLGIMLCDHWQLPAKVRCACEFHTLQDLVQLRKDSPSAAFKRMICTGNLLAVLSTDTLNDATKHKVAKVTRAALGCTEPEFLSMMGDIYDLKVEVEKFSEKLA